MESKVKRYKLEGLAIELFNQGLTEAEIADSLTAALAQDGVQDQISQPTVNRFLRPIREADKIETQKKIRKAVNDRIDSDIELVDEAVRFHAGCANRARVNRQRAAGSSRSWREGRWLRTGMLY